MIGSRRMIQMGHLTRMGEILHAYKILVGKPDRKRSLVRAKRKWEINKMDLKEIEWEGVNWIH
jgi:hypothetical protein